MVLLHVPSATLRGLSQLSIENLMIERAKDTTELVFVPIITLWVNIII